MVQVIREALASFALPEGQKVGETLQADGVARALRNQERDRAAG